MKQTTTKKYEKDFSSFQEAFDWVVSKYNKATLKWEFDEVTIHIREHWGTREKLLATLEIEYSNETE